MDYDVLILGGGIIGCAVAYQLSKYNLNIALIEKDYDVANDISFVNSSIIYDGSDAIDDTMSRLENRGMNLIKDHCKKFNIMYDKVGLLRMQSKKSTNEEINDMYTKSKMRGINGIHMVDDKRIYELEPNLKCETNKAFYSENVAVISPYNLAVSYAEIAADNGVNFRLEEEVIDIKTISRGFKVTTNRNKFTCKFVVNTIPSEVFNDKYNIDNSQFESKKIRYLLINEKSNNNIKNVIIKEIDQKTFLTYIPMGSKGCLIGINSNNVLDLEMELKLSEYILENISKESISSIFTESYNDKSILIDDSSINEGYIRITGNHYAKITIAPAIAQDIEDKIKVSMNLTRKKDYIDKKRKVYSFMSMNMEQRNKIIALDKRYGNIICNCSNISEGEIIDSIRRPLGARTVEGVKRRTGMGYGSCNGSYCNMKIIKILSREMNKSVLSIVDDSIDSKVLVGRIKEFNEI